METIKTAISIRKPLFQQAEGMARKLKVSRSRLFVIALEDFLARQQNRELYERVNAAYADEPDEEEKRLSRKRRASHRRLQRENW